MDKKSICFITAVNDELAYDECLFYIKQLNIPEGYSIEAIGIRDSYCMTYAYNVAMENSKSKYKIYIHQDTFIINKNFIYDILDLFRDDKIGMIGICGAKDIQKDGIWWQSKNKVGKIYDSNSGEMELNVLGTIYDEYESVQAIDGLIMITQYDIKWRDDIFDGWHFYDLSQSKEFIKCDYKVVVPNQYKPWCIHECGIANIENGFEEYRKKYIQEYLNKPN